MRRLALLALIGMLAVAVMAISCGGPKEVPEEVPVETAPPVEEDTTPAEEPAPPPPAPKLQETQFQTVYFDFDKYNLRDDAKASLDHNFGLLQEFPDVIVKIEGHCDERGTVEYNLSLGEKRAKSSMDYLVSLGIDPGRISIISYGKERPVDQGHNEEAWAKNRRSEFKIISQ
ncbi:MAG: peptidoglycan-associated lipoprotein Pal [Candidatus Zixiibacteriota bacterium]|nr:MAG: peptidoglycan-associated lipoprotein Pal [candidate division Zixibacteria bacterium]